MSWKEAPKNHAFRNSNLDAFFPKKEERPSPIQADIDANRDAWVQLSAKLSESSKRGSGGKTTEPAPTQPPQVQSAEARAPTPPQKMYQSVLEIVPDEGRSKIPTAAQRFTQPKPKYIDIPRAEPTPLDDPFSQPALLGHQQALAFPPERGFHPGATFAASDPPRWWYATSMGFRMYQFNLTKQALIENTLVCLPTGLGKTFVALNVMYNFWRWFPDGQIIFMAPTKPLLAQQRHALASSKMFTPELAGKVSQLHKKYSKIFGRQDDTSRDLIVLDGSTPVPIRIDAYRNHRIIFSTPQTTQNDLDSGCLDPRRICLLVIDEAHRAHGDYAYCNVVKNLTQQKRGFRVLALSATPGPKMEAIQEVISNLNISNVEILTDSDPEIKRYIQPKQVTPIEVNIDEGLDFLRVPVSACVEMCFQNLKQLLGNLPHIEYFGRASTFKSIGGVRFLQQEFQKAQKRSKSFTKRELGEIWATFGCAYALVGAKKALTEQGVDPFKVKAAEGLRKIGALDQKTEFLKRLKEFPRFQELVREAAGLDDFEQKSHPKVDKLIEIISEFCGDKTLQENNSRCMIFSNTRMNVGVLCSRLEKIPGARPTVFLGQSAGSRPATKTGVPSRGRPSKEKAPPTNADLLEIFSTNKKPTPPPVNEPTEEMDQPDDPFLDVPQQTETDRLLEWEDNFVRIGGMKQAIQKKTLQDFKNGKYNILIATCVGEEGLDIGEVDLTICYDEGLDPIRMWQRMGRTGRKRPGQIILLMSQDEIKRYQKTLKETQSVVAKLRSEMATQKRTGKSDLQFYKRSPRMVPEELGDLSLELVCPQKRVAPLIDYEGQEQTRLEMQEQRRRDQVANDPSAKHSLSSEFGAAPSDPNPFATLLPFPIPALKEPEDPSQSPSSEQMEVGNSSKINE